MASNPQELVTSLYTSELFSDFEVHCGGYIFPVHRSVLYTRSVYFRAMFSSQMKESREGKVIFEDLDPGLVARMLLSCYTGGEYPTELTSKCLPVSCRQLEATDKAMQPGTDSFARVILAANMYDIGKRFDIKDLRRDAKYEFEEALTEIGDDGTTPASMINKEECSQMIHHVYSVTAPDNALRNHILGILMGYFRRGRHRLDEYSYLIDLIDEIPNLSKLIAKAFLETMDGTYISNEGQKCNYVTIVRIYCGRELTGSWRAQNPSFDFKVKHESTVQDVLDSCRRNWKNQGNWVIRFSKSEVQLSKNVLLRALGFEGTSRKQLYVFDDK